MVWSLLDSLCAVQDAEIFDMQRKLRQADTCSHCVFVASSWFRDRCRGPFSRVPSYLPGYLLFEAVRTGLLLVIWPQYWPLIGWSNCMLFMFWRSHNAVWQGTGLSVFISISIETHETGMGDMPLNISGCGQQPETGLQRAQCNVRWCNDVTRRFARKTKQSLFPNYFLIRKLML